MPKQTQSNWDVIVVGGGLAGLFAAIYCTPAMVTKYQKRISGLLLDRIDIQNKRFSNGKATDIVLYMSRL